MIAKRAPGLQRFVQATGEAVRWAEANRDKAITISQSLLPDAPKDKIAAAIGSYLDRHYWSTDGAVAPAVVNGTASVLQAAGQLTRAITYDEFVDAAIAKP